MTGSRPSFLVSPTRLSSSLSLCPSLTLPLSFYSKLSDEQGIFCLPRMCKGHISSQGSQNICLTIYYRPEKLFSPLLIPLITLLFSCLSSLFLCSFRSPVFIYFSSLLPGDDSYLTCEVPSLLISVIMECYEP